MQSAKPETSDSKSKMSPLWMLGRNKSATVSAYLERTKSREHDELARSCNRPRFKSCRWPIDRRGQLVSSKRPAGGVASTTCLIISILFFISTTPTSCDDSPTGPTTTTTTTSVAHLQEGRTDELRVAAFASKLEQYLQCNRINLLLAINHQQRANLSTETTEGQLEAGEQCRAHFDGHLCWPAARVGETVRLACPKLSWVSRKHNKNDMNTKNNNQDNTRQEDDPNGSSLNSPTSPSVIINSIKQQQAVAAASQPASNNSLTSIRVNQPTNNLQDELAVAPAPPTTPGSLEGAPAKQTGKLLQF